MGEYILIIYGGPDTGPKKMKTAELALISWQFLHSHAEGAGEADRVNGRREARHA